VGLEETGISFKCVCRLRVMRLFRSNNFITVILTAALALMFEIRGWERKEECPGHNTVEGWE